MSPPEPAGDGPVAAGQTRARRRGRAVRLVLAVVVVGALVAAVTGVVPVQDVAAGLRRLVQAAGPAGVVLFVLLSAAAVPTQVLSGVGLLAAAVVWPAPVAVGLTWIAVSAGSIADYALLTRMDSPERSVRRTPRWLGALRRRLGERSVLGVVVLRVVVGPGLGPDALLAVARVPWRPYLVGTVSGLLLWATLTYLVVVVVLGQAVGLA